MKFVASITQEAQCSLSMINEETQLVFLDEWSDRTLASDMAKVVLQGSFMVQAIKHGKPRSMENRIKFYITTDELPYFGNDDVNVKRRVRVFTTKSVDSCKANVDRWIKDNPMDCIVWCAQEIENLLNLVDPDERWYEKDAPSESAVRITDRGIFTGVDLPKGSLVFDIDKMKSLDSKDLQGESQMNDTAVRHPVIFSITVANRLPTMQLSLRRKRYPEKRSLSNNSESKVFFMILVLMRNIGSIEKETRIHIIITKESNVI